MEVVSLTGGNNPYPQILQMHGVGMGSGKERMGIGKERMGTLRHLVSQYSMYRHAGVSHRPGSRDRPLSSKPLCRAQRSPIHIIVTGSCRGQRGSRDPQQTLCVPLSYRDRPPQVSDA